MNLFNSSLRNLVKPQKRFVGESNGRPLLSFIGGATTKGGKEVNHNTSLKISAFWCGVNTIANSIALLPKHVYNKKDGTRTHVVGHEVDYLIHREPNRCMTAFNFWFTMAVCSLVKGNGFARIIRNNAGGVKELVLLHNEDVEVFTHKGDVWYKIRGKKEMLFSDEIFHITAFSWNGIFGVGAIRYAADNLSIPLSADEYGSEAYQNHGVSYGVIETNTTGMNQKGRENLKKLISYQLENGGKHRVSVLDEGMTYKRIALSPEETKFIEAKAAGVEDIARWLGVPLHKLHTKGEGGYNFLVQMSMEYVQTAVMPLAQRIKEEIERKLLSPREKQMGHFVFINYRKLLEADPKARAQYYKDMVFIKAMNPNEVRANEDMNPYDGGDEFLQPSNMMTKNQIEEENEKENG